MKQHEYFDLINTVTAEMNWAIIVEAYTHGLPAGMFTREQVNSIETLRAAGILDGLNKVDAKWRKAIDDVCAERPGDELSSDEKKRVADVWYRSEFSHG